MEERTGISQLIKLKGSEIANDLVSKAMQSALSLSQKGLSPAVALNNRFDNEKFMCNYSANFQKSGIMMKDYLEDLEINIDFILKKILQRRRLSFCLHSNEKNKDYLNKRLTALLHNLKLDNAMWGDNSVLMKPSYFEEQFLKTYVILPSGVNYVTESFKIPGFSHEDYAKLSVMGNILNSKYLHKFIREEGGAYGSGVSVGRNNVLSLYSYRDPKSIETYMNFEKGIQKLLADGVR